MPSDRPQVVDTGLQSERTRLSWARTALSFAGMGALMLHIGNRSGDLLREVPGALTLCAAAAIYVLGAYRYRTTPHNIRRERPVFSTAAVGTVAALATLTAVLSLVLITF